MNERRMMSSLLTGSLMTLVYGKIIWGVGRDAPPQKNSSILLLKMANIHTIRYDTIFSAFWALIFTVQLHILHKKQCFWLKKLLFHAYGEQKTPSQASLLYCCTNTTNHPTRFHSTAHYRPKLKLRRTSK